MKDMEVNQMIYTTRLEYLDNVLSLSEASKELNITDGYLRQLLLKGEFEHWEYKKVGRVTILLKESVLRRKNQFKNNK